MRIDSPISCNAQITGSFTGSFSGDGTGITGVTAEWDGSHVGDASITGSLNVSTNVIVGGTVDGRDLATDGTKLDGIATGATNDTAELSTITSAVTLNTAKVGITTGQADAIVANTAKTGITSGQASAITANTAKVGITTGQADAIVANTAKTGITSGQASAITANTAKISFDSGASSKLAGIEAGATGDQTASEILTAIKTVDGSGSGLDADLLDGQSSGYYATATSVTTVEGRATDLEADVSAILSGAAADKDSFAEIVTLINSVDTTNDNAFGGYVTSNNAAVALNTAKTGITSAQASAITANTAKVSFDSSASSKLAGIAAGATNVTNNNQLTNGAGYITSYVDTNTTYSAGSGLGLSGTTFSHSDTSTQTSVNNSGRTYIQDITLDGFGHITAITSATETVVNTDTNTTYTAGNGLSLSGTQFLMSGAYTGNFSATGNITAYSDARLKKDVKTIEGALDKTKELRGVEFTRISDDTKSIGVIAQELEAVLPELVLTDDEGMKSVNYAQITGLLIEAVKELSAKVDELSK